MRNDYISIITPTYNSSKYITETIVSVINQTHKEFELIIVDDCSSDNTVNIIKSFVAIDNRIRLFENTENKGAAFARNFALNKSKFNYLAFIDSDDVWLKDKLERQISFMYSNSISFSFTGYLIMDKLGNLTGKTVDTKQKGSFSYEDMLAKKATLGCSTVMLNKNSFKDLLQMPELRTGQDYAFWLKLLKNTHNKAHILPIILTKYRIVPDSISRNKFKKAKRQWLIYRKNENLNFIKSIYYFCFYAFRAIFRTS